MSKQFRVQSNLSAIIVDDEQQSHQALQAILSQNHPEVRLLASGFSVADGKTLLQQFNPDLLFLDIEMPDGLGFDLLESIEQPDFSVIFITAHNQYAIKAIRFGALDYLLKPIQIEELRAALDKVHKRKKDNISKDQIQFALQAFRQLQTQELPTRFGISTSEGILYKKVEGVIRLQANQNYTDFHFINGEKITASLNIGEYVDQFESYPKFMKVHRSHVVNLEYVERFVRADGGYLVMQDKTKVNVSRLYKEELIKKLELL